VPSATSTLPSSSNVAVWLSRAVCCPPTTSQCAVDVLAQGILHVCEHVLIQVAQEREQKFSPTGMVWSSSSQCMQYPSPISFSGSVSKVEIATPMGLIYKVLFPSISTFETPPKGEQFVIERAGPWLLSFPCRNLKSYRNTPARRRQNMTR